MPAEVLFVLLLVLTVVTVLGHGIWLLLAAVFRRLVAAPTTGRPSGRRDAAPIDDLWGFSRTVARLRQWQWIDADEEQRLHDLGRRYQARVLGAADGAPAMVPGVTTPQAAVPAVAVARHPLDPDPLPPPRIVPAAATAAGTPNASELVTAIPVPATNTAAAGRPAWLPAAGGRAASEVLRSFLAAHNIRWGELVAGLLIVVCSIGLVISLWSTLAATHRLLPALVFLAGTAAIEAAGLYTLRRWRLRHTSRAVLLIATLLMPLSVVAGVGMAGTGADAVHLTDPLTAAFLLLGALVYGGAIWLSGRAMVRLHDAPWWTLSVVLPTALLPLVPAAIRAMGTQAGWIVLLGSLATAVSLAIVSGRGAWRLPLRRRPDTAIRNRWLIALVGGYSLAVLIAFMAMRGGGALAFSVPLAIASMPALVALAATGLAIRRDSGTATMAVVGGAIAVGGGLGIAAVLPVTLAWPMWLVGWALAVAGTALVMAVGLNLRWLVTLAAAAGGMALTLTAPGWLSDLPWQAGWMFWRRLVAGETMIVAAVLGIGLVLLASLARVGGRRLQPYQTPLAVAGACWATVASAQAIVIGGLSWLPWMPPADVAVVAGLNAWQLAVAVLAAAGATAIAAAARAALPRWLSGLLLAAGQSALLVSLVMGVAWSRPALLLDWRSWSAASAAVWWWIGLLASYALVWQVAALVCPRRSSMGRLLRRWPVRVDQWAGGAAGIATVVAGGGTLLRLLVEYHQAQFAPHDAPVLVPVLAMAVTAAYFLLAAVAIGDRRRPPAGYPTWLTDTAILTPHAMLLWWLVRLSPATLAGMTWTGSGSLAGGVVGALLAWWGLRRIGHSSAAAVSTRQRRLTATRWTQLARLADLSGGWSGAVLVVIAAVLLKVNGADLLPIGGTVAVSAAAASAVTVVAIWMAVAALALALAAVVASRRLLGFLAAALLPASAALAATAAGADYWQSVTAAGWGAVLAVAGQRLWDDSGGHRRLRALAVTSSATSETAAPAARWPLAVVGLAQFACVVAIVVAAVATVAVWSTAAWAVDAIGAEALGLIAATAAMAMWAGHRFLFGWCVGVLPVVALGAGTIVGSAARWQGIEAADAWRGLLWVWLGVSAVAAVHYAVVLMTGRRWPLLLGGGNRGTGQPTASRATERWDAAFAVAMAGVVAGLGYAPRALDDPVAWASIAACGVAAALAVAAAWRNRHPGAGAADWTAAQCVAIAAALAAAPLLVQQIDAPLVPQWVAAVVVAWWFGWAIVWRLVLPARETVRMPRVDALLVWLGIVPLAWLLVVTPLDVTPLEEWGSTAAVLVGTAVAVALLLTAPLRVERRGQTMAAYITLLCVVLGISGSAQRLTGTIADFRLSGALLGVAAAAALLGWVWPLRRSLRHAMQRRGLLWSDLADRLAEAELACCVLATTAAVFVGAVVGVVNDWDVVARYLAIGAVGLCGWAISGLASRQTSDALRIVTVLVFCAALALAAVAGPAAVEHRELIAVMRLLVVGVLLVPINLWLAARGLGLPLQQWQRPLAAGAAAGAGLAAASLGLMLVAEVRIRTSEGIAELSPALVIGVAVVLGVLSALCVVAAVAKHAGNAARVLPDLADPQRKGLIYAAQTLAALAWLHVFLCRPDWGLVGLRPYWPLLVMGLAFLSAAATEWGRRRGDQPVADALRQTSLYLPLIPVIGFWLSAGRLDWAFAEGRLPYAVVLAAGAAFYGGLSMLWRRDYVPRVIAVVLGNAALWVALAQTPGWHFTRHPQLWLIPPAVCVLVAVHWERRRLDPKLAMAIRYAAALLIYVSSTADMLLQEIGSTIGGPIVLVMLALVGLAAGVVLRVRAFLYLGTTFVLVGVLSMVWHAQQAIDQVWPWWVFGITSGVLLLVGLMALEKNKGKLKEVSDRLAAWEG